MAAWAHAGKVHAETRKGLTPDKRKEMNAKVDSLLRRAASSRAGG